MGQEKTSIIAETEFSISKYCKSRSITERLPLLKPAPEGGPTQNSNPFELSDRDFIEIAVRSNFLENELNSSNRSSVKLNKANNRASLNLRRQASITSIGSIGQLPYIEPTNQPSTTKHNNRESTTIQ